MKMINEVSDGDRRKRGVVVKNVSKINWEKHAAQASPNYPVFYQCLAKV